MRNRTHCADGGREKASAITQAIWRKIDFQTGDPAYVFEPGRGQKEWRRRRRVVWGCLVGRAGAAQISSPPPPLSTLTVCIKVVTSGREFLGFCVMSLRFGAKGKRAVKAAVKRG